MRLIVTRTEEHNGSTIGTLLQRTKGSDKTLCHTLEDGFNEIKEYGETRIPKGVYRLKLREYGGFHQRYCDASWMPEEMHKGMLQIMDVEGFTDILIHTGNTKEHTHGCLLLGKTFEKQDDGFFLQSSRSAYKAIYPLIRDAILSGEEVSIEFKDNDRECSL